jgi:ribosomal-protein-serine acetyltransferase
LPVDLGDGALLRRHRIEDAEELYAAVDANRDRLDPWMPWAELTRSVDDQRKWIVSVTEHPDDLAGCGVYVDGVFAAGVGLHQGENRVSAEIGYWNTREWEGRGLVTRAVLSLMGIAFDELGFHRVYIRAAPENDRSRAIPEKLGFIEEAVLREETRGAERFGFHDLVVYGMLEDEWRARPPDG